MLVTAITHPRKVITHPSKTISHGGGVNPNQNLLYTAAVILVNNSTSVNIIHHKHVLHHIACTFTSAGI